MESLNSMGKNLIIGTFDVKDCIEKENEASNEFLKKDKKCKSILIQ